ncbi:MAG TPA: tetratricopeptide repeat protein, partial [Opitutaceae bacterium]
MPAFSMASPDPVKGASRDKAACLRALAANPDDVGLLSDLGWACRANGEPMAAEAAFRRAIALEPAAEAARYGLAVTCLRRGKVEEGIQHIRVCLERAPANHAYWTVLAKLHRNSGRIAEARDHLRTAMALAPDDSRTAQRMLFQSLLDARVSPVEVRREHESWAARFAAP